MFKYVWKLVYRMYTCRCINTTPQNTDTYSHVVQMGLKLQNTKNKRNRVIKKDILQLFPVIKTLKQFKLTGQTNWAHVTDFNEVTVAETRSSVVHVCRRRQHQLWPLLRVRQEHPLLRRQQKQLSLDANETNPIPLKCVKLYSPTDTVQGRLSVVSSGTVLQLYHKPEMSI